MSDYPTQRLEVNIKDVQTWWLAHHRRLWDDCISKAVAYSSTDLARLGWDLVQMGVRLPEGMTYAELGCWFYVQGKIARAMGSLIDGRMPTDDTVQDIEVYATMIARIRDAGGWPS